MRKPLPWPETVLPALSLTLGLQIIRTIWPYLRDLLDDRLGWNPVLAALVPFLVFATTFLTKWVIIPPSTASDHLSVAATIQWE